MEYLNILSNDTKIEDEGFISSPFFVPTDCTIGTRTFCCCFGCIIYRHCYKMQ